MREVDGRGKEGEEENEGKKWGRGESKIYI